MNAPPRTATASKDEQIRESSFSPKAFTRRKYDIASYTPPAEQSMEDSLSGTQTLGAAPKKRREANLKSFTENQSPLQAQVKDYTTLVRLALACPAARVAALLTRFVAGRRFRLAARGATKWKGPLILAWASSTTTWGSS
jgi:hypothetical protein